MGMFGFDKLYVKNKQAEDDALLTKHASKVISANLLTKVKTAMANAFAPTFTTALA
jgi:hypothetical protein